MDSAVRVPLPLVVNVPLANGPVAVEVRVLETVAVLETKEGNTQPGKVLLADTDVV